MNTYKKIANDYQEKFRSGEDIQFFLSLPDNSLKRVLELAPLSKSQIRQDLFALVASNFKRNGYFVEFGATDGVSLSNTHLLEKMFDWRGILAEPSRHWHHELRANRKVNISLDCVWSVTGTMIDFVETEIVELSTASEFIGIDSHAGSRIVSNSYLVKTISLNDLLESFDAPTVIDYLSIDTEGSEFLILSNLDFLKWHFQIITVEHNFTSQRKLIEELLTFNGYKKVCQDVSRFDDWYLSADLIGRFDANIK
jgi:FkbM family methyltransferase